jgi:YD repeat-containing protein
LPGYVKRFDHNAAGQTTFLEFANGNQEFRTFDPDRNWSRSVHVQNRGLPPSRGLLFYQAVEHDHVGHVRQETLDARRRSRTDIFTHDDLGRLTNVVSTDPVRNRDFAYDLIGNMTYHSQLNKIYYNDNAHVHAVTDKATGEHFIYDAIGQLKSSNRLQLDWTVEHRPRQIVDNVNGTSKFAYDSNGRRVKTETPAGMTVQPNPLVDIDSNGEITT